MIITKDVLWDTELTLREAGRDDLANIISGLLDEVPGKTGNFINRENYFASILWSKEDIEQYLEGEDIEYDDEMVNVLSARCKNALQERSADWDVIEDEVSLYLQELGADREDDGYELP